MAPDPRFGQIADTIIQHSINAQIGDRVLIRAHDLKEALDFDFLGMLIEKIQRRRAIAYLLLKTESNIEYTLNFATQSKLASEAMVSCLGNCEQSIADLMTASIIIGGGQPNSLSTAISPEGRELYMKLWHKPVYYDTIVAKKRWVLLNFPTQAKANEFGMSLDDFKEFYLKVMSVNYAGMAGAMSALQNLMSKTDKVHIKGPAGTDLSFSIKGIPSKACYGKRNLPDGEVFTAPVKYSINGNIQYNTPTHYDGEKFEHIYLEFTSGKITGALAGSKTRELNAILDRDDGSRYCGEFSFGLNPNILDPVGNILFDEKICGSIHLTPGSSYDEVPNGNKSAVHWDLVLIQRPDYGGGEIYFDGELIRRDGLFVLPELECLNPEKLV